MTTTGPRMKPIRTKLAVAAAAAALHTALRRDLSRYLTTRRTAEHTAVSLRVTFPGVCMRRGQRRAELTAHTPQIRLLQAHTPGPDCPA